MPGVKQPTERSSFRAGSANSPEQHRKSEADVTRKDEYNSAYKSACEGVSDEQKWGTGQNPVSNGANPFRNMRSVGPT